MNTRDNSDVLLLMQAKKKKIFLPHFHFMFVS